MASGFFGNRRPTRIFATGVTTSATYTTSASVGPTTAYTTPAQAYYRIGAWAESSALGSAGTAQLSVTFTPPVGGAITASSPSITLNANVGTAVQLPLTDFIAKSGSNITYSLCWSGVTGSAVVAYAVVIEAY